MKIRTKLSLLAGGVAALYTLGLLVAIVVVIVDRFYHLELDLARRDFARVEAALEADYSRTASFANDYARWDDTWDYASGANPGYPAANFIPSTYTNAGLSFIAVYDRQGRRLFGQGLEEGELVDRSFLPPSLQESEELAAIASTGSGYLLVGDGVEHVVASSIVHSDLSGPEAGVLLMGTSLDEAFVAEMAVLTGVRLSADFRRDNRRPVPPGLSPDTAGFASDGAGRSILGTRLFRTAKGTPAFTLTTSTARSLSALGATLALILVIIALAVGALVLLAGRLAFRDWILHPLRRLEAALDSLDLDSPGAAGSAFAALARRPDEIGQVAGALTAMGERIVAAHELLRRGSEELESKVLERTAELEEANRGLSLYGKILESAGEAVIVTDLGGNIVDLNEATVRMSGWSREELLGRNPRVMKSDRHPREFYEAMWSSLLAEGRWAGEVWDRRRDGTVHPKWLSITAIRDASGRPVSYAGIATDISEVKAAEERAYRLAYFDQLTGLPNRSLFADRMERAIARARRKSTHLALMFIDLDRFKNINDSLGHAVGDGFLVLVARRLTERLRETDTVCRLGGDEFAVILEEIARGEDAGALAQSIIKAMADPFEVGGNEIYGSTSLGIAIYPRDGTDAESLVKKADAALYLSKESGRSTWRFASSEMDAEGRRRLEVESRLHGALERGEFRLWYQAQTRAGETVGSSPEGLVGAEALIRWQPGGGRVVGPGEFIDIAEETGLIVPIGDWAIREACREARRWADAGRPLQVSVNVSLRQFADGRLPATVAAALAETGLPPALLKLEVTESMFMRNMGKVIDTIRTIRECGVSFAIDDFGTGYSSLQYLNRLPVDCLKIDKAFVQGMGEGNSGGEIVTAVISMGRAFGMMSIAEGVETEEELDELRRRGCDLIQGYLVSKPLPAGEFADFAGLPSPGA